ncbi:P-II family nitrogen regulator [Halanaerobium hydrogeniformans]|uniref:Nitrogen regulatory protein P-II n=1 Tax=Halanaerobium hydrogeniformans TaxID=656519 RepID=E4RNG0_HALHG|nr:P-II family nitrogen regulator [Halanaerobium hydrogeniformans]ADQ13628.1 nitrogen regulatory protein P-II [Halanaerobium hydrogeniformans]
MKKIEAYIRPEKLNDLIDILESLGLKELSLSEIKNYNFKQIDPRTDYFDIDKLKRKIKVELIINYNEVDKFVDAIKKAANTGNFGDGKIFVYDIENAVRIRTGEEGVKAL